MKVDVTYAVKHLAKVAGRSCPASIAAEFVENPTAVLDTSCVDELPAIDYAGSLAPAPSDDEIVELAEEAGVEDLV